MNCTFWCKLNSVFWNEALERGIIVFKLWCKYELDRVKRICYLSPMRAAKVQASLRIRAVSPEPSLLAHTSSESRGTFRQKARSLAPLNGWACAVEVCYDGMLEDTNSLDGAHVIAVVAVISLQNFRKLCMGKTKILRKFVPFHYHFKNHLLCPPSMLKWIILVLNKCHYRFRLPVRSLYRLYCWPDEEDGIALSFRIKAVKIIEPPRDKTNKKDSAPIEDLDQTGSPPSLIRVFTVRVLGGCPG